jgi:Flp pilus assembly protein TadG
VTQPRREAGQATVELVLVLPVVAMLALVAVQVAVVAYRQVLVVHAAREGARAAAVEDGDRSAAASLGSQRSTGLDPARLEVTARSEADTVKVVVAFDEPTDVALVGRLLPSLRLEAAATMRIEGAG